MAVQVEAQGQLQEFVGVLSKRRWQVLLPFVFVLALGCAAAVLVPKKYRVQTRIELREARVQEDPQLKNPEETPTAREINNAEYQIKHYNRIERVVRDELRWDDYVRLDDRDRQLYITRVMKNIQVAVLQKARNEGSTFVDIYYSDITGKNAVDFLKRISRLWIDEVINRDRTVLRRELDLAQERKAAAEKNSLEAGQRLSELLQQNDLEIVEASSFGQQPQDKIDKRLAESQAERDSVQASLMQTSAQIAELESQWSSTPPTIPITEVRQGLNVADAIAQAEGEVKALRNEQKAYKPAHSAYKLIEEKIQEAEKKIAELGERAQGEQTFTRDEPNPERPKIRAQIDQLAITKKGLDARLGELTQQIEQNRALRAERVELLRKRDELKRDKTLADEEYARLEREYATKKAAFETATEAYGNPFEITQEPLAPAAPNEPNIWMIIGFAGVAGLAIGLGWALLAEYTKSCYRSVADVARVLSVPVLGSVNTIVTRAEERRLRQRRIVTALATIVILAGLSWFTWAADRRPEALPTPMRQAIEDLRLQLR